MLRELAEAARDHAHDEGYIFVGPVGAELVVDVTLRTGSFHIDARLREGPAGAGRARCVLPSGERLPLGEAGGHVRAPPESTLVLADPNVSRNHAEIRPPGNGYVLVDLGSTNGTRVNGTRIATTSSREGDEVTFGNTVFRFEAS